MRNTVSDISASVSPQVLVGPVTVVVSTEAALSELGSMKGFEVVVVVDNVVDAAGPAYSTVQVHQSAGTDKNGDTEWLAVDAADEIRAGVVASGVISLKYSATVASDATKFPIKPTIRVVVDVPDGASIDVLSVRLRD